MVPLENMSSAYFINYFSATSCNTFIEQNASSGKITSHMKVDQGTFSNGI